jgi:hypothetical protein
MDKAVLVDADLKRSERIVSLLENAGVPVTVAMWVQLPEYDDWRFIVSSKSLDLLTFGEASSKVNRILTSGGLDVWEIPPLLILKTSDSFIRALRKVFRNAANVVGMRLGGQTLGDRYIDDALAYKIA